MKKLFIGIKWFIKRALPPLILILVWIFNVRPFSNMIPILDSLFNTELASKIKENQISPATLAAIDVALLTFVLNALIDVVKKIFKPLLKIKVNILDKDLGSFTTLTVNKDDYEQTFPTNIKVKIHAELESGLFIFKHIFRGVRLTFFWHPEWLTVDHNFKHHTQILNFKKEPGNIHCNIIPLFSESDNDFEIEGEFQIMLNKPIKKFGSISTKVQINSNKKFLRFMFNWLINILITTELKSCKIHLRSEK
ncbi:hypothetical protein COK30_17585 [Bacillus cereus]|uniref:hypothetical protein n=1 Tax=Bacillus cereus TaxID=1396 RepID=UPI000BF617D4|nr:hypothetical protein [Bacillus cereus]PFR11762.1 hypothetical protein COK30_17585 [Bacillus cereus]